MVGPAPQPERVSPAAPTGMIYATTSIPPASGVSGVGYYNGPWIITTQSLDITYHRVPRVSYTSDNLTLVSGVINHNISNTKLAYFAQAYWSQTSSSDAYPTSGTVSQPQKFDFYPVSSDIYGNSYGALTASTLGPMGEVKTIIPYYERRMATEAEQAIPWPGWQGDSSGLFCSNHQVGASACGGQWWNEDQTTHTSDFKQFAGDLGDGQRVKGLFEGGVYPWSHFSTPQNSYQLPGGYSTDQEYLLGIFNWVTEVGEMIHIVRQEHIPSARWFPAYASDWCPDFSSYNCTAWAGIPEYDPNRHDYS